MSEVPLYTPGASTARASEREVRHKLATLETMVPGKNNFFTEMCSGSEAGSYLRLIDLCITNPTQARDPRKHGPGSSLLSLQVLEGP